MARSNPLSTQHLLDHPRFKGDRRSISIGDYVWMPLKIVVLPGVSIGNYAVIGTGSVVASDVPEYGVAVGNLASVIKERARVEYKYVPSGLRERSSRYRAPGDSMDLTTTARERSGAAAARCALPDRPGSAT